MAHIELTEEQSRVLSASSESVEVRDNHGRLLAFLKPLDPALVETILECKRRLASPAPRVPSQQVQAHLRKLEEMNAREDLDEARVLDLLRRMRAGEEV